MKKTVVITGGAGFIGSHLSERLLKDGKKVIVIDNFVTGSKKNIAAFQKNPDFQLIEHNISEKVTVPGAVDYILHFASPASPIDYLKLPIQTLKVGALGTHNALGLAKAKKSVFLLASTSEVYGDPLVHPQKEEYWGNVNPIGPRGVYDEAKRFAEAITMAYYRAHKVNAKIIRIFNTYGPRMRLNDGRAIPSFIAQALRGQPISVYGKGNQTRSFCYISDLVEGVLRMLYSDLNEPVNLGNPNEMTIMELAKVILKMTGSKSKIIQEPLPEDDPKVRQPDISKAKKFLQWEPKIDLKTGLKETIAYFQSNLLA